MAGFVGRQRQRKIAVSWVDAGWRWPDGDEFANLDRGRRVVA